MKTNALIRIVLLSLILVILVGLLVTSLMGADVFSLFNLTAHIFSPLEGGTTASSGTVQSDQIKNIEIEWISGTITLQPGDGDVIRFSETSGVPEKYTMIYSTSGDTLMIQYCSSLKISSAGLPEKDLVITVPADWLCSELSIDAADADIKIYDQQLTKLELNSADGRLFGKNCSIAQLDIDAADIDISFSGQVNRFECDAASAYIDMAVTNHPSRFDLDMADGVLNLTLPSDCGFQIRTDCMSKSFSSEFDVRLLDDAYIFGDGHCVIDISAMSVEIGIQKGT